LFGRRLFEREAPAFDVPDAQPYTLEIVVAGGDASLERGVRNASALAREADRPPPGTAGLLARARGDFGRVLAALYAEGYYGGSVRITVGGTPVEALRPDI